MITQCRLCGQQKLKLYYTEGDNQEFEFYKCLNCKLVNYDISAGVDQEKHANDFEDPKDEARQANSQQSHSYEFIKKHFPTPGKMLDIGCGSARILYLAQQDGWDVTGMDLLEVVADSVNKATGINVIVGDFLKYQPDKNESYDLVCLRHVLEHLPDSTLAMSKIRDLLSPNGYAVLEFPNIKSFDLRIKWFLQRNNIRKRKFAPEYVPHHCNEFCKEAFEYLLTETGMQLIKWQTYSSNKYLSPIYNFFKYGNKVRVLVKKADKSIC